MRRKRGYFHAGLETPLPCFNLVMERKSALEVFVCRPKQLSSNYGGWSVVNLRIMLWGSDLLILSICLVTCKSGAECPVLGSFFQITSGETSIGDLPLDGTFVVSRLANISTHTNLRGQNLLAVLRASVEFIQLVLSAPEASSRRTGNTKHT